MRIVGDTNVLSRSAINPNGMATDLLRRICGSHVLLTSYPILAELLIVLRRPKIQAQHGRNEQGIHRFISSLYRAATVVRLPQPVPRLVPHDAKDDAVLFTAIAGHANVLTTRDRHFFEPSVISLAAAHGVRILGDDQLLVELDSAEA